MNAARTFCWGLAALLALGDAGRADPRVAWAAWVPNLQGVQVWLRCFQTPQ